VLNTVGGIEDAGHNAAAGTALAKIVDDTTAALNGSLERR